MILMVDARTMGSKPSGIGMSLYNFLKEVVKDSSIRLILVSDVSESPEIQDIINSGANILLYGRRVFRSAGVFAYFRFVVTMAKKYKADIFWEPNNLIPLPMLGFKGKIALTVHDIFPISTPENYGKIYRIYFRILLSLSIKQTDFIMYVSDFTKKETEKYLKAAKRKKNGLSYNIIPGSLHENAPDADKGDYFLYIGNIERRKGTDLLIKAYEKYCFDGGKRPLYLAGGIKSEEIRELLEETNQRLSASHLGNIEYLGYVSKEEKADKLSRCAGFLFPSRAEGFGMPIVEAMTYYRPVIASGLDVFRELMGESILYYETSEKEKTEINHLAKAMSDLDSMYDTQIVDKKAYDEVLMRFSPERLGKNIVAMLKNMI